MQQQSTSNRSPTAARRRDSQPSGYAQHPESISRCSWHVLCHRAPQLQGALLSGPGANGGAGAGAGISAVESGCTATEAMSLGSASSDVENHKHRMLATEYGIRGYTYAEPQKNHLRSGEIHANECAAALIAGGPCDSSEFGDRAAQAFDGALGENARVLISILTCSGARLRTDFKKLSSGGKSWGRINAEWNRAKAAGRPLAALELAEHSMVARVQLHGLWSDANHSEVEKVSEEDVLALVAEYNETAPTCDDPLIAMTMLRKAERMTSDAGLAGRTIEMRKLRVLTMNNLASLWRRRGRLHDAFKCLQTAQVVARKLGAPPRGVAAKHHTSEHAICVLKIRGEGLQNLDDNGLGGLSDPFLSVSSTISDHEKKKMIERRKQTIIGKSWLAAKDAVIDEVRAKKGKVVYRSEIVMNTLSPPWKRIRLPSTKLCSCDLSRPIALAVYDWDKDGTHDLIGSVQVPFLELQRRVRTKRPLEIRFASHVDLGSRFELNEAYAAGRWAPKARRKRGRVSRAARPLLRASRGFCISRRRGSTTSKANGCSLCGARRFSSAARSKRCCTSTGRRWLTRRGLSTSC